MDTKALVAFEQDIKSHWEKGEIHGPVHFVGGNEDHLIRLFQEIAPQDWVFTNHRSHYHALLKGVPSSLVKQKILDGKSIHLNFHDYRVCSSAIVAGNAPIAVGVALASQLSEQQTNVWCFVGDMAAETGIFYECVKFANLNDLPIHFIVEDNGFSVQTPAKEVCGPFYQTKVIRYSYERAFPHQGTGTWVAF